MPTRREHSNKALIARIILVMFAWVLFLLVALSLLSFHPADVSHVALRLTDTHPRNWGGSVGAIGWLAGA